MEGRGSSQDRPPEAEGRPGAAAPPPPRPGLARHLAMGVILAGFWLLLSGRVGLQYFLFMAVAIGIVMFLNPDRPFGSHREAGTGRVGLGGRARATGSLIRYLVWLVWNVAKANVEVALLILRPGLPIRPRLLTFTTTLQPRLARVIVANSITLTPGTVTIDLKGNRYLVHALVPASAAAVTTGALQNVVAPIFGEGPDPIPEVRWAASAREVEV